MDREKVIKGLQIERECVSRDCDRDCGKCDLVQEREWLLSVYDDAIALLEKQEWILITEDSDGFLHNLPGDDGAYLMTDGKDIWIDEYVDGVADGIFLDSGRDIRDIKAWMYMPELPKQEGR